LPDNFVFTIFAAVDFKVLSEVEKCFPVEGGRGEEGRPDLFK